MPVSEWGGPGALRRIGRFPSSGPSRLTSETAICSGACSIGQARLQPRSFTNDRHGVAHRYVGEVERKKRSPRALPWRACGASFGMESFRHSRRAKRTIRPICYNDSHGQSRHSTRGAARFDGVRQRPARRHGAGDDRDSRSSVRSRTRPLCAGRALQTGRLHAGRSRKAGRGRGSRSARSARSGARSATRRRSTVRSVRHTKTTGGFLGRTVGERGFFPIGLSSEAIAAICR